MHTYNSFYILNGNLCIWQNISLMYKKALIEKIHVKIRYEILYKYIIEVKNESM